MTDKKMPKHIITIEIYEEGNSKLIPSGDIHPDFLLDVLHQHMRIIERNIVFSEVIVELSKKKILLPNQGN